MLLRESTIPILLTVVLNHLFTDAWPALYYATQRNATSLRPSPSLFRRRHLGGRLVEADSELGTESREIIRQPSSSTYNRSDREAGNTTSGLYKVLRVVPETGRTSNSYIFSLDFIHAGHQLSFLDQLEVKDAGLKVRSP